MSNAQITIEYQDADGNKCTRTVDKTDANVVTSIKNPGFDIASLVAERCTALMIAALCNDLNAVCKILAEPESGINAHCNKGFTALMIAAEFADLSIVETLLKAPGIEVNQANFIGSTALIIAARHGRSDLVRMLLADPRTNNINAQISAKSGGTTALIEASQNGHVDVVRELAKHLSIDLTLETSTGATAWMLALYKNHFSVLLTLLEYCPNQITQMECEGTLILASQDGHIDLVRALLTRSDINVNIDATDSKLTALMCASSFGHLDVVNVLLGHPQIDVTLKNSDSRTALTLAFKKKHDKVVIALFNKEKQADPDLARQHALAMLMKTECSLSVAKHLLNDDEILTAIIQLAGSNFQMLKQYYNLNLNLDALIFNRTKIWEKLISQDRVGFSLVEYAKLLSAICESKNETDESRQHILFRALFQPVSKLGFFAEQQPSIEVLEHKLMELGSKLEEQGCKVTDLNKGYRSC